MPHLFDEFKVKDITLRNRIGVSPMCQYSSEDGMASDWHLVHLGARAVGGAGLVIMEATSIDARGRITREDNGIWSDAHVPMLQRITKFIRARGAVAGMQLAHAGWKASRLRPWDGEGNLPASQGGWEIVAPSALAFSEGYRIPKALSREEIQNLVKAFAEGAGRALDAGFEWLEIHGAHGYLIHSFLSPLSNHRTDEYGGSFENRIRFAREVVHATRKVWPERLPLTARFSCTDWMKGGWTLEETVELSRLLKKDGVDLIDCSSGGISALAKIPVGANYQVPLSQTIRREAGIFTATVGLITEPMQADAIIRNGDADLVYLARELLRDPYWPLHAAHTLHQAKKAPIPPQYLRAF